MQDVTIEMGTYRGQLLSGVRCKLMKPIRYGARGWYGNFDIPGVGIVRVQLPSESSVEMHGVLPDKGKNPVLEAETDDIIIQRLEDRFAILNEITEGVADGDVRSLIVSGAPGVGKSEGIRLKLLEKESGGLEYNIIHGNIVSAFQLYQTLYDNSEAHNVLVLDDCDSLLFDPACVNLLKAALESGNKPRVVSYQSNSVENKGIPTSFEFEGSIIFVTNIDFQAVIEKDRNIAKHLAALLDRSLYLDLTLHSRRDVWCRILSMVRDHGLLDQYSLGKKQVDQILEFIKDRQNDFRSLSLRTALQLGQFVKTSPKDWRRMAEAFQIRRK